RHEKQSEAVQARADQIRRRTESLTQLLARWRALGEAAGEVNRLVQQVAASAQEASAAERIDAAAFREVDDRLCRLAEDSGELARVAQDEEFLDLGTQAESLRLQFLSARNKFRLLERRAGQRPGRAWALAPSGSGRSRPRPEARCRTPARPAARRRAGRALPLRCRPPQPWRLPGTRSRRALRAHPPRPRRGARGGPRG